MNVSAAPIMQCTRFLSAKLAYRGSPRLVRTRPAGLSLGHHIEGSYSDASSPRYSESRASLPPPLLLCPHRSCAQQQWMAVRRTLPALNKLFDKFMDRESRHVAGRRDVPRHRHRPARETARRNRRQFACGIREAEGAHRRASSNALKAFDAKPLTGMDATQLRDHPVRPATSRTTTTSDMHMAARRRGRALHRQPAHRHLSAIPRLPRQPAAGREQG